MVVEEDEVVEAEEVHVVIEDIQDEAVLVYLKDYFEELEQRLLNERKKRNVGLNHVSV